MEERAGERRLPVLMNNACSNIGVNEPPLPRPSPPFGKEREFRWLAIHSGHTM
jgi:hypothetical protein